MPRVQFFIHKKTILIFGFNDITNRCGLLITMPSILRGASQPFVIHKFLLGPISLFQVHLPKIATKIHDPILLLSLFSSSKENGIFSNNLITLNILYSLESQNIPNKQTKKNESISVPGTYYELNITNLVLMKMNGFTLTIKFAVVRTPRVPGTPQSCTFLKTTSNPFDFLED